MNEFNVVMRGYHRGEVDALVAAVEAAAGDQDRIHAAIEAIGPPSIVLRGYEPSQVDSWLAGVRAAKPIVRPVPDRRVVLRGYRIAETDALLAVVGTAVEGRDPFRRAEALQAIAGTRLPVALRGYDRGRIDAYLNQAERLLRAS